MDIEGGEVAALHGMATMIDGEDMTFLAELNGAALERAGTSSAALLTEFADHGYQFFSVETGGRLSRTSQETLLAGVLEIAAQIASKSPMAIWGTKKSMQYSQEHTIADGLEYIANWNASMFDTDDMAEAFAAQMEQRDADFPDLWPQSRGL